ncbi:MAG: hypothetical protein U0L77_04820 [Prevotellamassilia sp.]|nr:hypothetical protein [Prevotellamassilia sp.]
MVAEINEYSPAWLCVFRGFRVNPLPLRMALLTPPKASLTRSLAIAL